MTEQHSVLRIVPELRNYHLANASVNTPSETYYFDRKYDLVGEVPPAIRQASFVRAIRLVASRRFSQLVIWEPLWVRLLPKHVLLVLIWKCAGVRRQVLSYAMENNDLASLIGGVRRVPRVVVKLFSLVIGGYMRAFYTRIAYANEGSRLAYQALPWVAAVPSATIPNLPGIVPLRREVGRDGGVVVVARMERRKGTDVLMREWPKVESSNAQAQLTIIGGGPESDRIATWAAEAPERRHFLGPKAHEETLERIAESAVLLLPSVREGRWREQIGLPIHEGLINGLTIVTTDETGLAEMLSRDGHYVVPASSLEDDLAPAILAALARPLDRASVQSVLPAVDGRVEADHWLVNGERP